MRRILVLGVALSLLMLLRQATHIEGYLPEGVDPMTLAAVGFVVLTAFTLGELGGEAGLPRITGYILSGVALGPQVSNLLSSHVVQDMRVFNTLALGLIAMTAGLELDFSAIRKVFSTLLSTLIAKLPLLILLVGGVFFGLETSFGFIGLETTEQRLATALILAVLGIGTSPAIVLAIANETASDGRLTKLALAMSVVKDLVVVVSLAVAIAIAEAVASPDASFRPEVLLVVAEELAGSLVAGAMIGGLLVAYVRFIHREMLLVVLVVILLGAELAHALHLELLLMFITAGFVVRNLSAHEEELHHPLTRVALPVFVVFFTTAGATVDLHVSAALLPLALSLVVARMLAFFIAGQVGARLGGEAKFVRKNAWLTYWPQAGITLGLVTLAAKKLPELGPAIEQTGLAVVALNLLVGPVAVGWGLRRAGEVEKDRGRGTADLEKHLDTSTQPVLNPTRPPIFPLIPAVENPRPGLKSRLETEPLISSVSSLSLDLEGQLEDFIRLQLTPFVQDFQRFAERILGDAADARGTVVLVRKVLSEELPPSIDGWDTSLENLHHNLLSRVLRVPARLEAPLSDGLLVARSRDPWGVRLARWRLRTLRRFSHSSARTRTIHLQVIARHRLEPRIAAGIRALNASHYEHYARILDEIRAVVASSCSPAEARAAIITLTERWIEASRQELQDRLRTGINEVADLAAEAGVPGSSASRLRLSEVQVELITDVDGFRKDSKRWQKIAAAELDTLRAEALVEEACNVLEHALELRVSEPLSIVRDRVLPIGRQTAKRLQAVLTEVSDSPPDQLDLAAALSKTSAAFPKGDRKRLERARASFGRLARQTRLPDDLARIRAAAPERLDLLPSGTLIDAHKHPDRVPVVQVPFAERIDSAIAGLIAEVRDGMTPLESLVLASDSRLRDSTHLAAYGVEAAHTWEGDNSRARRSTAVRALGRGQTALERLVNELSEASEVAEATVKTASEKTQKMLRAIVRDQPSTVSRVRSSFLAQGQAVRSAFAIVIDYTTRTRRAMTEALAEALGLAEQRQLAPQDAGSLRRLMAKINPPCRSLDLPAIYLKVFDLAPVADLRMAVARSTDTITASELLSFDRSAGRPVSSRRLIIEGVPGSGRTSFLNVLERNTKGRRIVRIDSVFNRRPQGLIGALAVELGCGDYPLAVTQSLLAEPTLVLVDDLSLHIMPTPNGIKELEELLRIVTESARQTAWAVTVNSKELRVLTELVPVFGVFNERFKLHPLSGQELEQVVEARIDLAGLEVRYPSAHFSSSLRRNTRLRAERRKYFEQLAENSDGNLREALVLHLQSLRVESDGGLRARRPQKARAPQLSNLAGHAIACLAAIARFGPLDEEELAQVLLVDREAIRQQTMSLIYAGLLESDHRQQLRLPLHSLQIISRSLNHLGLS